MTGMDMEHFFQMAVRWQSDRNASDDLIFRRLLEDGVDRSVAAQLVMLLPLAYGREGLGDCGVTFSSKFVCTDEKGDVVCERSLSSLSLWNQSVTFVAGQVATGSNGEAVSTIAARSPEIDAINKALHDGQKLEGLVVGPPVFLWPEFYLAIGAENNPGERQPWWRIWRRAHEC
jgi:hypothetical protein